MENKLQPWQFEFRINMPLDLKVRYTEERIRSWYEHFNGSVYISFSGGKDSTVLLHIARKIYPEIKAVFSNTGLEYPEIVEFVKQQENVEIIRPKLTFKQVLEKYGYPVISKQVSRYVRDLQSVGRNNEQTKNLRLTGLNRSGKFSQNMKLAKKWLKLVNAPFKISEQCCTALKTGPLDRYCRKTKNYPIIATLAAESSFRKQQYMRVGCNSYAGGKVRCAPMSFWKEQDVLQYIKQNNLKLSPIYGDLVENPETKQLKCTGEQRTGCIFCVLGVQYDETPNRFQRLKVTHPKLYDYCINNLNIGNVLNFLNIKY